MHFLNFFHLRLRPERLKIILGLGPVAVLDTLEGGGGSLRPSRRARLPKALREEGGREVLKNLALEALSLFLKGSLVNP